MKTIVEMEIKITNGRVMDAKVMPNGTVKVDIEVMTREEDTNTFRPQDKYEVDGDWN